MKTQLCRTHVPLLIALGLSVARISKLSAQESRLVDIVVHSTGLEGNMLDDSPDRNVTVYLPPGYDENPGQRYPVLYLLHGYIATDKVWTGSEYLSVNIKRIADSLIEQETMKPMILVMPNARNKYNGAWYTNSPVTGNWEDFITQELVQYIDNTYRTLSQSASRGIAGHSLGGAEAMRLAMKFPDLYSAVYGMSASPMEFNTTPDFHQTTDWIKALSLEQSDQFNSTGLYGQAAIAAAASFSPNPDHPPFFVDFPFEVVEGKLKQIESIWQKWLIHDPVAMVTAHRGNLRRLRAIHFDCGTSDPVIIDSRALAQALAGVDVAFEFEEYDGNHLNNISNRVETRVFPFFSEIFVFELLPPTSVS